MAVCSRPRRLASVALLLSSVGVMVHSAMSQEPAAPVVDDAFVSLAVDEARGVALPKFLRLVQEASGAELKIGEEWREGGQRPPIRCVGTMRIRRTALLGCVRTVLWANEWTCTGEGTSYVVAPRGSKPPPGKVALTPWVASDRLAAFTNEAHDQVLAVINAGRSITLAGAAPDLATIAQLAAKAPAMDAPPVATGAEAAATTRPVRIEGDHVLFATDEERGLPLPELLLFADKFTAGKAKFVLDEAQQQETHPGLVALGAIKVRRSDFVPWLRASLWANGWACLPRAEGDTYDVSRRTSERARKLQDAVPWVAPDRLADYKDKPETFVVTTIDLTDAKRSLTVAGAGPDVHCAAEMLARWRAVSGGTVEKK